MRTTGVICVALLACLLNAAQSEHNVLIALRHAPGGLKSPLLGSVMSAADVASMIGRSESELQLLKDWLMGLGAQTVSAVKTGDYILASLPAERAATLTAAAAAHAAVRDLVEFVRVVPSLAETAAVAAPARNSTTGGNKWRKLRGSNANPNSPSGSPPAQKSAYQIPATQKASAAGNRQMVWGPGTFGFSKTDLGKFYKAYQLDEDVSLLSTKGFPGQAGGDNYGECTLDMTYISSMGMGVKTTAWNSNNSMATEEGKGFGTALLQALVTLSNTPDTDIPLVLSMSLGSLSFDACDLLCKGVVQQSGGKYSYQDCDNYMQQQRQVCMFAALEENTRSSVEFMKLGARGVTLLAATGDGGSHFSFEPFPNDPIGKLLNQVSCQYTIPTFPADSPWVVGVGGTEWTKGPNNPVAWYGSGSGFSWRFEMPDYQKGAVSSYIQAASKQPGFPASGTFNASNRAYPDVAALADNVPMVIEGFMTAAGGTSASAPSFAGVVSLINDVRLNNGLKPLGFVNPRLYAVAAAHPGEAFFDVVEGNSKTSCSTGFPATPGWDPTTGLGSPLWPGMLKYLSVDS